MTRAAVRSGGNGSAVPEPAPSAVPFRRGRPDVAWDEVILPEAVKRKVEGFIGSYPRLRETLASFNREFPLHLQAPPVMRFRGDSGTGKTMLAEAIATRLGKELLSLSSKALEIDRDPEETLQGLFREAELSDGILFFDECDRLFADHPHLVRPFLTGIERTPVLTILATNGLHDPLPPDLERRILLEVDIPFPDRETRGRMWRRWLGRAPEIIPDLDPDTLARRYPFTGGDLRNLLARAALHAARREPEAGRVTIGPNDFDRGAAEITGSDRSPGWRFLPTCRKPSGDAPLPPWTDGIRNAIRAFLDRFPLDSDESFPLPLASGGLKILVRDNNGVRDRRLWQEIARPLRIGVATGSAHHLVRLEMMQRSAGGRYLWMLDPMLLQRLCVLRDNAHEMVAVLEDPDRGMQGAVNLLSDVRMFDGILLVVAPVRKLHTSWRKLFHLEVGDLDSDRRDTAEELVRGERGFIAERLDVEVDEKVARAIATGRTGLLTEVAYRAWVESVAMGGGGAVTSEAIERHRRRLESGSDALGGGVLFGGAGTTKERRARRLDGPGGGARAD